MINTKVNLVNIFILQTEAHYINIHRLFHMISDSLAHCSKLFKLGKYYKIKKLTINQQEDKVNNSYKL